MKNLIGNLLLVLGTVLGGLAAANSAKASRTLALEDGGSQPEEFLARAVVIEGRTVGEAGASLTPELVAALRAEGMDEVLVKDPPRATEPALCGDREALAGRILGADLVLGQVSTTLEAGLEVDAALLERLAAAGHTEVAIFGDSGGNTLPVDAEKGRWAGSELAEDVTLVEDEVLSAGTFFDDAALDRVAAIPDAEAQLRIIKAFSFGGWQLSWLFAVAMVAMVAGVVVKRSIPVAETEEATPGAATAGDLTRLVAGVAQLEGRAGGMEGPAISEALGPLLEGEVFRLVEGRHALQASLGGARFAEVFGPFASGERFLNRAWSAGVDGYAEEARACLTQALERLREAEEALS